MSITVRIKDMNFYSSMEQGKTTTLAEVSFTAGEVYKLKHKGRTYECGFLGFEHYKGSNKYCFCVFENDLWNGYMRTNNWSRLKTMSNNHIDKSELNPVIRDY